MLVDKITEIKDHLLEVEAETGTLTEEQIEESVQAIRHAIDEHYKIADIPDPYDMIEAENEKFVKSVTEIMAKNKQRRQFVEIIVPVIEDSEKMYGIKSADIKILRVKADMDQRTLAQAANMSNNTISRLENGLMSLTELPSDKVISLLKILNVNNNVCEYLDLREEELN